MFKSKNVNDKRCAYKSKFFNKKIEKDFDDFWHWNWLWKTNQGTPPLHQFSKFDTVKLGNKEQFDNEQIGIKEPFPVTNLPFTS